MPEERIDGFPRESGTVAEALRGRLARVATTALLGLAVLASSIPASAEPRKPPTGKPEGKTAEAKRLFEEGAERYWAGDYEAAVEAWERSYELSQKSLIFESIANAHERLGQPKKARDYLTRWRAEAPKSEHDLLDTRLKNLDARIAREDAIEAARKAEEERLAREAREAEGKPTAPAAEESSTSLPGVILVGGGAAAVAVGVTLGVLAAVRRPDPAEGCASAGDRQLCQQTLQDAIEGSSTLATVGDVAWIAGGVAATLGIVLLVTHSPTPSGADAAARAPRAPAVQARLTPVVAPGRAGVSFALQY